MNHDDVCKFNQKYYNSLWSTSRIFPPRHWAHYSIINSFPHRKCLEIGPGTKPKIPVKDGYFLDISSVVVDRLNHKGANAQVSNLQDKLPYPDNFFYLVCAFELLEHVPNDEALLLEIRRVLKKNGTCLLSFPINMKFWNNFDVAVGHVRRYNPGNLDMLFRRNGFEIQQYAVIEVGWPSQFSGKLLLIVSRFLPKLTAIFQDFVDSFPGSILRKQIRLKSWTKKLSPTVYNTSTIFLQISKIGGF